MNKKIIALAVAAAFTAPVAMADMKISGRVAQDFTIKDNGNSATDDTRGLSDSGHTRLQFDGSVGNAFARIALDERLSRTQSSANQVKRDSYVGYKFGGGTSAKVGRLAGTAKNLEKDPYIATFLETRSTIANSNTASSYGSSSFNTDMFEVAFKTGAAKIKVQYGASENTGTNNGHIGIGVSGKAGAIAYFASYNNGSADGNSLAASYPSQTNIKLGGSMKFGKVKATLMYTSMDKDAAAPAAGTATDSIFVDANMGLGDGMSANVGYATRSGDVAADDATFIRLAVTKKLGKGVKIYGGYTTTDFDAANVDTSEMGVGMLVKF